jgi:hypothetical protein
MSGPVITDSQRRDEQLDRLFKMAKHDAEEDDDDEAPVSAAKANAPPADDDDW